MTFALQPTKIPWVGLVALLLMFLLPARLFEGPRTVKHRPTRHICADCGAPWVAGHACDADVTPAADGGGDDDRNPQHPLRAELRRLDRPKELQRRALRPRRRPRP
jgi:hypothetical protein